MATSKSNSNNRTTILAAIIGAVATIAAAIFGGPLLLRLLPNSTSSQPHMAVRVADGASGASIPGAKVLLFSQAGAFSEVTDANGATGFRLGGLNDTSVRLIIETDQYEIYERVIQPTHEKSVDIRLKKRSGSESSVIFRVVDDVNNLPIASANTLLLVQGNVFNQTTDSNGIAKFTLTFPNAGQLDSQLSVSTRDYEINHQNVTLLPNKVQDIRLNPRTSTIKVSDVTPIPPPTPADPQPAHSTPVTSLRKNGVVIQSVTSSRVDSATGIRVNTESSSSAKNKGELQVIIRTPDDQPFGQMYVAVHRQKTDLNNQPIRGDRMAEFRTDETGSGKVTLNPGMYGIWLGMAGAPWQDINFNLRLEAGQLTTIILVPSQLVVTVRRADGSLITNSYVSVSTQKLDLNGKPLIDERILEGRTRDTGEALFDMTPGTYAIYLADARGEDWGMFNNTLPPATQLTYNITLGRIRIEARDEKGDVVAGAFSRVRFQKRDANNNLIPGDIISEGRTDATGGFNHDLTPGIYMVESNAGVKYEVEVKSGAIVTLKEADFKQP